MENLHKSVRRTVAALSNLRVELDTADVQVRRSVRLNLDIQLAGLVMLEREIRTGKLTRRVWSLGQASLPVVSIVLKSISQQAGDQQPAAISECREAVSELGDALERHAEGR